MGEGDRQGGMSRASTPSGIAPQSALHPPHPIRRPAIFHAHSLLFVPGSRPDRVAKAAASDADAVCIDLEDAVGEGDKDAARANAMAALATLDRPRLALRINGLRSPHAARDLVALADAPRRPAAVFVPMCESAAEAAVVRGALPGVTVCPLIETVAGLTAAHAIAAADGVGAVMLGGADLSAQLGVELAWEPLLVARAQVVIACAGAGVPAIDAPFLSLTEPERLAEESRRARALGFAGKAAIHPDQLAPIHAGFRPSEAELARATEALAAYDATGGEAMRHAGRMLEAPIVRRYRRLLGRETGDA